MPRPTNRFIATLASVALTLAPLTPALAGGGGGYGGHGGSTPDCPNMGGHKPPPAPSYKNININKNINIFKPVVINKNININKNVIINKNVVINKVSAIASAEASAISSAGAASQSQAGAQSIVYAGSYQIINYKSSGTGGAIAIAAVHGGGGACHMQEANVVKSIHAVCVSFEGREYAASHMVGETWIDSGYEGEIARCIPGSHLKVTIGDVLQSDQGLAGTYEHGQVLECGEHEALRHFKDGMVKCAPAIPVPDCTERTNLRRWGTGDFFFSFRAQVCVGESRTAEAATESTEVGGMTLDGGVGDNNP